MEAVPRAGLPPATAVPRGLGTGRIESFTGYAARMSARIAVPASVFVRRAFADAGDELGAQAPRAVASSARRLNVGALGSDVATALRRMTGHPDLRRPSCFAFLELFGVGERGVLALRRRWCPTCWPQDDAEPYERRVWWLALVDVCHSHRCLLDSRCSMCGRLQPTLPSAVRIHVCSYCGRDLHASTVVSGNGPVFERMVWYAREAARRVHAGEAIELSGRNESESLRQAYEDGSRTGAKHWFLPSVS